MSVRNWRNQARKLAGRSHLVLYPRTGLVTERVRIVYRLLEAALAGQARKLNQPPKLVLFLAGIITLHLAVSQSSDVN